MSVPITIDGTPVELAEGQTLLDGARKLGIDIPTLCFLERTGPMTSCLVCIVKLKHNGRTSVVPSCGMKVQAGMVIESETDEMRQMRRTALELLLSDHVGDCFAPCQRICPLKLEIPEMLRHVSESRLNDAMSLVRDTMPLASVTGRLCNHPCEQGCRRGTWDDSMAIRDTERNVADAAFRTNYVPRCKPASGKKVAIVGSGPAGLSAAWQLTRDGHACTVLTRGPAAGGTLRTKSQELLEMVPGTNASVTDNEIRLLADMGVNFSLNATANADFLAKLTGTYDAIVVAIGESARTQAATLGIPATATGLKVDPNTLQSAPKVFVVGAAVKPVPQVTRAIGEGLSMGRAVDQFLKGQPITRAGKQFSSIMGKLEKDEVELFVKSACSVNAMRSSCGACGVVRESDPAQGSPSTGIDASTEALRCLHCDCRALGECSLQYYSEKLGADPGRFRQHRRRFEQHEHPGDVLYEPGKCILCGICVEIAKQASEPLGLTFVGRGFDVRVAAPMNKEFETGLQKVAQDCVESCPTGAISFRKRLPS